MADLAKKKRIRAGHKGSATKTMNKVDDALAADPVDMACLSLLKLTLSEKLETIKTLDAEVVDLIEDEAALIAEIEQADEYRESLYSALLKIAKALEEAVAATPSTSGTTPRTSGTLATAATTTAKLPKLRLKAFSGDLTQWMPFWESFEAAVHSSVSLTSVEKFNYLTSVLEGSAREAIAGLSLTAANYDEAVCILKKRFGCKQKIIDRHMEAMLKIGSVSSCTDVKGLRRLFDQVSSHIRSLKSLHVGPEAYGSLLCPVLITRLPSEIQLIVSRKVSGDEWQLDELLQVVEEDIVARERVMAQTPQPMKPRRESKPPPSAVTLMSDSKSRGEGCCYCGRNHFPTSCDTVKEVEARKQVLRKNGRCFLCLRKGHLIRNCRTTHRCRSCNGRHHTSICSTQKSEEVTKSTEVPNAEVPPIETTSSLNPSAPEFAPSTSLYLDTSKTVILQTSMAEVYNPNDQSLRQRVRMVLDGGSQRSYLTERTKQKLKLVPKYTQQLSIAAFGAKRARARPCDVVSLRIQTKSSQDLEVSLFVVPHICDPLTAQPVSSSIEQLAHLSNLDLADYGDKSESQEVDLLIGSDVYWDLVSGEVVRGDEGPVAIHTKLGWILSGPVKQLESTSVNIASSHVLRVCNSTDKLDEELHSFWELESLGICKKEDPVQEQFEEHVQMKDGRYQVSLPWQKHHKPLPTNYEHSLARLKGLLRRLKQDTDVLAEYDKIMKDQLSKGIVERVGPDDFGETGRVHYLPHHAVIRRDKETSKVRIVYDASSRSTGPSLNDCLHTGPKYNQKILELLIRFRSYPVAVVADIEKAFLMISVDPKDRNVLRFLWVEDVNSEEPKIIALRFTRVAFGISSSPFLLNATIQHHVKKYLEAHPILVRKIQESIYVDDVVGGDDDEELAYKFYKGTKRLLQEGSFNLRKFLTNFPSLQGRIDLEDLSQSPGSEVPSSAALNDETYAEYSLSGNNTSRQGEQRVLGIHWNVKNDHLVFDFRAIAALAKELQPTKRNVISIIGRFYDPLGYLSPVIIQFKIYMQELCKSKLCWDECLPDKALNKWNKLVDQLKTGFPLSLPRCCISGPADDQTQYRLYGFCDSSKSAYAAVIYLAEETVDRLQLQFVMCKTRVAPLKVQTIPRLELLSALLLTRIISNVSNTLSSRFDLQPPKCFTDSQVALYWITGVEKEWKPFVQNRVNEIRETIPISSWNHCPGSTNPADIPSRGVTAGELSRNELWEHGPDMSRFPEGVSYVQSDSMPDLCFVEMKAHTLVTPSGEATVSNVIDIERFSSLHKLCKATAYVLRFVNLLMRRPVPDDLTPKCIYQAELEWVKDCQLKLEEDKKFATWRVQFGLFKDSDQIWRCRGRLQNADLPLATIHPILLDRNHPFVRLVVIDAHYKVLHNGVKETLSQVRAKYWIIRGRSVVKRIIKKCVVCLRFEGLPFSAPPAPPLPTFRVNEVPPFTYTAVDYAGPLYLRKFKDLEAKVWISLFTCCVTRAVHLEVVSELSTVAFIRCFKKFTARRGLPRKLVSDNAQTFKAAAKAIKSMLNHPDVRKYLLDLRVEWNFNLEKAPWWGGLFERLIKSTKRCLRKMIGQARLSYDEMHTAVVEVESILNSRPLSYVTSDDIEEPLTPSHLLVGRRLLSLPDDLTYLQHEDPDFELTTESLQRRVRYLNSVINHFWRRWSKEYLLELRESHRYLTATNIKSSIRMGDVVLIEDCDQPRGFWRLAKVEKLLVGKDGQIRGAEVRVSTPTGQRSTMRRPLQALYPLELNCPPRMNVTTEVTSGNQCPSHSEDPLPRANLSRGAATKARKRFKRWAEDLLEDTDVDH